MIAPREFATNIVRVTINPTRKDLPMRAIALALLAFVAFESAGPTDLDAACGGGSSGGLFARRAQRRAARRGSNYQYQSSYSSFQSRSSYAAPAPAPSVIIIPPDAKIP